MKNFSVGVLSVQGGDRIKAKSCHVFRLNSLVPLVSDLYIWAEESDLLGWGGIMVLFYTLLGIYIEWNSMSLLYSFLIHQTVVLEGFTKTDITHKCLRVYVCMCVPHGQARDLGVWKGPKKWQSNTLILKMTNLQKLNGTSKLITPKILKKT